MKHENTIDPTRGKSGRGNQAFTQLRVGSNRTCVNLELIRQGRDFLLLVTGGEAHVGAVAVWDSAKDGGLKAEIEMSGHREGPLAGECASILGRATGRTVVAVVGIHQDNASRKEIEAIVANVRQGALELASLVDPGNVEKRANDD